jgi:uncharacterized protein
MTYRSRCRALTDGTRLSYNVSFSRIQVVGRRSYSVTLRPDITLDVRTGPNAGLHLFDAKFKLTMANTLLAPDSADADEAEECHGTFRRGDLYKMHAYRDAIVGGRSVWILYPGDDTRFFPIRGDGIRFAEMLPNVIDGVGAIPLQPDEDRHAQVGSVLARLANCEADLPKQLP